MRDETLVHWQTCDTCHITWEHSFEAYALFVCIYRDISSDLDTATTPSDTSETLDDGASGVDETDVDSDGGVEL